MCTITSPRPLLATVNPLYRHHKQAYHEGSLLLPTDVLLCYPLRFSTDRMSFPPPSPYTLATLITCILPPSLCHFPPLYLDLILMYNSEYTSPWEKVQPAIQHSVPLTSLWKNNLINLWTRFHSPPPILLVEIISNVLSTHCHPLSPLALPSTHACPILLPSAKALPSQLPLSLVTSPTSPYSIKWLVLPSHFWIPLQPTNTQAPISPHSLTSPLVTATINQSTPSLSPLPFHYQNLLFSAPYAVTSLPLHCIRLQASPPLPSTPAPPCFSSRKAHRHPNYMPYQVFITSLFYFVLFYFILFYFILFYFILFYFILFYLFVHRSRNGSVVILHSPLITFKFVSLSQGTYYLTSPTSPSSLPPFVPPLLPSNFVVIFFSTFFFFSLSFLLFFSPLFQDTSVTTSRGSQLQTFPLPSSHLKFLAR